MAKVLALTYEAADIEAVTCALEVARRETRDRPQLQRILEPRRQGKSFIAIGRELGISRHSVRRMLGRNRRADGPSPD